MSSYVSFAGAVLPANASFNYTMEQTSADPSISSFLKEAQSLLMEMMVGTTSKSQLVQYNTLIKTILKKAPGASDYDFKMIEAFAQRISNQYLKDHLEFLQARRQTEQSPASYLRDLANYKETLIHAWERSTSKKGLPWEPHALGTSLGHQLSEKRSLLNILSTALNLIEKCLLESPNNQTTPFFKIKKKIEESISKQRLQLQELNRYSETLVEAEKRVFNREQKQWILADWNHALCQRIYGLIKGYEEKIFDLNLLENNTLKKSYPSFDKLLDKLATDYTLLNSSEKEMALLFLKEAEKEYFISKLIEQRTNSIDGKSSHSVWQIYKQLENHLSEALEIVESIVSKEVKEISRQILKCIREMNVSPPSSEPNWKKIVRQAGYKLKEIGKGKQGVVWRASQMRSEESKSNRFIIKSLTNPDNASLENWYRGLYGERTARIIHPSLLHIEGAFLASSTVQAVIFSGQTEGQMNLLDFFSIQTDLSKSERYEIGLQLIQGLQALHTANRIHKDLKPENILVRREGNSLKITVIDPGFQERLTPWKPLSTRCCGSPRYIAPEVDEKALHGKPADIYSLGALLYALFTGYNFSVTSKNAEDQLKIYPDQLKDLILSMLSNNPEKRPVIAKVAVDYSNLEKSL